MPDLEIRLVDPTDSDEMQTYQRLYEAAERAEFPDATVYTIDETIGLLTRESLGGIFRGYAAFAREDGRMVGEGVIVAETTSGLDQARLFVWVPPTERRRGVGSAMVEFLVTECVAMGRGVLQSNARFPFERRDDHPVLRFAARHGFALANLEVVRRLALPVDDGLLDALAAGAAPHHDGYRLRTVVGPIPAELAQGYCDAVNRLRVDAPSGDLVVGLGQRTPEVLADQDREIQASNRTRVTVFALDDADRVAAFTCAVDSGPDEPHIDQWATIVVPAHRGHRLGLAIKVAQTRVLQELFAEKRFVATENAESNTHMIAVNEALGYRAYALSGDFQRILPDV